MKKILILILTLSCLVAFTACNDNFSTPQHVYIINREYTFGDTLRLKTENDVENEQFIITYTNLAEEEETRYFKFDFHVISTFDTFINDDIFEYSDNLGSEIIFNEDGHYDFIGDRTFYVSYANSPEEIKTAIANYDFDFVFYTETFAPPLGS